jgi:hypothetical protein
MQALAGIDVADRSEPQAGHQLAFTEIVPQAFSLSRCESMPTRRQYGLG